MLALVASTGVVSADFRADNFTDTPSPNTPIEKPECDDSVEVAIRYSETSARLYLESADNESRGGCVTLDQIWEERAGKAPLYAVDPETGNVTDTITGTWLLTESLYVEDGVTLQVGGVDVVLIFHCEYFCFFGSRWIMYSSEVRCSQDTHGMLFVSCSFSRVSAEQSGNVLGPGTWSESKQKLHCIPFLSCLVVYGCMLMFPHSFRPCPCRAYRFGEMILAGTRMSFDY